MNPLLYRDPGPRPMEGVNTRDNEGILTSAEFAVIGDVPRAKFGSGRRGVTIDLASLLSWIAENEPYLFLDEMAKQRRKVMDALAGMRDRWSLTDEEVEELLK